MSLEELIDVINKMRKSNHECIYDVIKTDGM